MEPDDDLKAENALLRLKIELEHGGKMNEGTGELSPEVENKWLNSVYEFEKNYKNIKQVKVYDRIGRPPYKKIDEIKSGEISKELRRLQRLLVDNGLSLDCICEYDDEVIYRFLTGELFEHEMDDIRMPGWVTHFTYEEFHPNHDYDLRRHAEDFVKALLRKKWQEEYDGLYMAKKILYKGKLYHKKKFTSIILTFQESHFSFKIESLNMEQSEFDLDKKRATVAMHLKWNGKSNDCKIHRHDGSVIIEFIIDELGYWNISSIEVPGF